ncbi:uncharacterized protein LOC125238455 [Leguminivora glycinivorella]|uniref:uncharacterized protein LOC125238455 n=1 Tax=Leguminivora glycinivorella TaxID=1035111 RepID=UPI00201046BC|nr:uncharacterized protein LOC125238455 [Leguminivora glycinivorella]
MDTGEDAVPPDKNGGPSGNQKRPSSEDDSGADLHGKKSSPPSASIQHTYVRPGYENANDYKYAPTDLGPFVVHVSREDTESTNTSSRMKALKMAQIIYNNKVPGIKEIKALGKTKMEIHFATASEANSFLSHDILTTHKLSAAIPRFQVSRMGVVRQIPLDWTLEEFVNSIECPTGSGPVVKARRLNKKREVEGRRVWEPTGTVALTFLGQVLPEKIYSFSMSLPVSTYKLPIIQCRKCVRFGHIKEQCRSNPRCSRCSQNHETTECSVPDAEVSCLFCSGPHAATNQSCPEFARQRSIKLVMVEENIGYIEAARRFRPVRTSFADIAKTSQANQPNREIRSLSPSSKSPAQSSSSQNSPTTQTTQSYRKTILVQRRPKPVLGKSYDVEAHRNITSTPQSSQSNGCALGQQVSETPNDNLSYGVSLIIDDLLSRFGDILPYSALEAFQAQICASINKAIQNGLTQPDTMEC